MRTAEAYAQAVVGSTAILAPRAAYDAADGSWTMTVEGVASAGFGWKDGQWAWRIDPGLKPEFAPDRSKASWRELPAIFGNGGYSQAAWSIDLPQRADGYTLEGVDRFAVDLPAFSYERAVERNGTRISSREALRETGAEVPASEIGATRKAASDVRERMSRIVLPASYPQRWDDVALAAGSPELARVRRILAQRAADKPDDASRIADQGWLAMRLLDWPAAEAAYSRALALDTTLDRYVARGRLRAQRGNLAGALADARAAYDLDGNNEEARALLVAALSESGKADEALTLLEPDPSLSQQDGETKVVELAGVLSRAGRTEELFGLLDRTIAQRASSALLLNSRCWFKALAGQDLDGALADCSRAVELAPGPAAVFDSRAMVHFRAGRLAQARADLDAALALEPELAPTRFMRGIVAGKLGDRSAAARDLAAARKMHPAIDGFFAAYGIKP
ncbi:MAG: tetratricopeptide repeat protein [Novosphingobium sp.]